MSPYKKKKKKTLFVSSITQFKQYDYYKNVFQNKMIIKQYNVYVLHGKYMYSYH